MQFSESGLFLIGACTGITEVVSKTGESYGLYTINLRQPGRRWDAKADFSLTEWESEERTKLGAAYEAGELDKFVGRRVAVRVIGVPSKNQPEKGRGYVNYKAVSVIALDEDTEVVAREIGRALAPAGQAA